MFCAHFIFFGCGGGHISSYVRAIWNVKFLVCSMIIEGNVCNVVYGHFVDTFWIF